MAVTSAQRMEGKRKKHLAFILATLEIVFWLTFSKLQVDIQSKSDNFAHKVEPKLNVVRLLSLFHV